MGGETDGATGDVIFDRPEQLKRVQEMLLEGETLYMVLDCKGFGTGFLGVTDKRVILRDDGFAKFKRSIVSIPYSRLHAVGVESGKGFFGGSSMLTLSAGDDDWQMTFRGSEKARAAYSVVMEHLLGT